MLTAQIVSAIQPNAAFGILIETGLILSDNIISAISLHYYGQFSASSLEASKLRHFLKKSCGCFEIKTKINLFLIIWQTSPIRKCFDFDYTQRLTFLPLLQEQPNPTLPEIKTEKVSIKLTTQIGKLSKQSQLQREFSFSGKSQAIDFPETSIRNALQSQPAMSRQTPIAQKVNMS